MLGFIAQYFYQSKPPDEDSNEESASPPVVVESKPKSANPVKPESPTSHSSLAEVNFPSGSVSGSQSALVQRLNQVCANISGRIQCDLRFNWWNLSVVTLLVGVIFPTMTYPLFAVCRLVLGTLYPAYASYKAVRTKNVREYVKWMMYWIVFALFTTFESIGDLFIAFWFPFYYELKIVLLLWLISPVSRGSLGSSMLYRKLVHPNLLKREDEIDRMLGKLQEQGYNTAIRFGSQAFQYVTNLVMTTAIRAPELFAEIANNQRRPLDQVDHPRAVPIQHQTLERNAPPDNPEYFPREAMVIEEYESFQANASHELSRQTDQLMEDVDGLYNPAVASGTSSPSVKRVVMSFSYSDDEDDDQPGAFTSTQASSTSQPGGSTARALDLELSSDEEFRLNNPPETASSADDHDPAFDPNVTIALTRRARAAKSKANGALAEQSDETKEAVAKVKKPRGRKKKVP